VCKSFAVLNSIIIYEDDIQYSIQIPLIGNTALIQKIEASCPP
jgi:hypothetical protein